MLEGGVGEHHNLEETNMHEAPWTTANHKDDLLVLYTDMNGKTTQFCVDITF